MSQDERLMILQMVADKKISAKEAADLLRAIDGTEQGAASAPRSVHANPTVRPNGPTPPAPTPPLPLSGLGSFIENMVERMTSVFSDMVEPRYEFTSELAGEFPAGEVPLRIFTGNGRVEVKGWDESGFKAIITVKAGGTNEEEARRKANSAYTIKAGENGFDLETRRVEWPENIVVHVELMVPKDRTYRLEGRTGNGRMEIQDVALTDNRLHSGNGRIALSGVTADRLFVRTGNGSMDLVGDIGDLDAGTGNGSVTVSPLGNRSQTLKLSTGNGSIRIHSGRLSPDAGLKLDVNTGMGGATITLPNLVYDRDVRTMPNKQVVARTPNFEQAAVQVVLVARTGMGSVSVD